MKKFFAALTIALSGNAAFANQDKVVCQNYSNEPNQGYQVVVTDKDAVLFVNGMQVGALSLTKATVSNGGDQYSSYQYIQNEVNGYAVTFITGGFTGLSKAVVYHGGFVGYSEVADLGHCL